LRFKEFFEFPDRLIDLVLRKKASRPQGFNGFHHLRLRQLFSPKKGEASYGEVMGQDEREIDARIAAPQDLDVGEEAGLVNLLDALIDLLQGIGLALPDGDKLLQVLFAGLPVSLDEDVLDNRPFGLLGEGDRNNGERREKEGG
jgi:hypothetical protein